MSSIKGRKNESSNRFNIISITQRNQIQTDINFHYRPHTNRNEEIIGHAHTQASNYLNKFAIIRFSPPYFPVHVKHNNYFTPQSKA
jgi:hypothetical protein